MRDSAEWKGEGAEVEESEGVGVWGQKKLRSKLPISPGKLKGRGNRWCTLSGLGMEREREGIPEEPGSSLFRMSEVQVYSVGVFFFEGRC